MYYKSWCYGKFIFKTYNYNVNKIDISHSCKFGDKFVFFSKIVVFNINIYKTYYDRIDNFKGIDINKISTSKECIICYYCYFLHKGFTFSSSTYNGCYDTLMMSFGIDNIDILIFMLLIIVVSLKLAKMYPLKWLKIVF